MNDLYAKRPCVGSHPAWKLVAGIGILVAVAVAAGLGGFWYSRLIFLQSGEFRMNVTANGTNPEELDLLIEKPSICDSEINSISKKLGQFQAEILRINALGERLVEKAGLSQEEFNFQSVPPQGGPEYHHLILESKDHLNADLDKLFIEMQDKGYMLSLLEQIIMEKELHDESHKIGRPVFTGYVSSYFGFRKDPFHGRSAFHSGVDYVGRMGNPILAVADGIVISNGTRDGYGRVVDIRHVNGLVSRYAHCQNILVNAGELVKKGQIIATIGSTGRSTGPHLHFEVLKNEVNLNPLSFIAATKVN